MNLRVDANIATQERFISNFWLSLRYLKNLVAQETIGVSIPIFKEMHTPTSFAPSRKESFGKDKISSPFVWPEINSADSSAPSLEFKIPLMNPQMH